MQLRGSGSLCSPGPPDASMLTFLHESPVKSKLPEKATARRTAHRVMAKKKRKGSDKKQKAQMGAHITATARRTAHRVMAKKKRKGSDKKQKASRSRQGKQRQE
ncbi:hypothetical protein HaLaN_19413, partial [Haematococcus lacustris]